MHTVESRGQEVVCIPEPARPESSTLSARQTGKAPWLRQRYSDRLSSLCTSQSPRILPKLWHVANLGVRTNWGIPGTRNWYLWRVFPSQVLILHCRAITMLAMMHRQTPTRANYDDISRKLVSFASALFYRLLDASTRHWQCLQTALVCCFRASGRWAPAHQVPAKTRITDYGSGTD